jgi:hypothetical protein
VTQEQRLAEGSQGGERVMKKPRRQRVGISLPPVSGKRKNLQKRKLAAIEAQAHGP